MNFFRKTLLVVSSNFCLSFLLSFTYFILILNNIIISEEGTNIINIVLMSYSLVTSILFFVLALTIKNYKIVISNRNYMLEFFCTVFPVAGILIAWDIFSALFAFFQIVSFVIFIFLLFAILFTGLIIHVILSKRKEVFFIFNKGKIKVLQYEKGEKTILLEKDIAKEDIIFDDSTLTIQIKDTSYSIRISDEKHYFKKKEYLIKRVR